ncbi:type II toxin-antitoxin system RelE/ParE family toxin [Luteolibacter flavescens]|uniref:Type II toxin-antitoxin system RelE/ParE family toxin n=1 Tax=Luteolibacter flavescens TaxID=1859460 RepID=A0ABT3FRF8_9BACT|nr:type II toxin-antitoxin system RelE/ParE family toxin [Luteolibacter flavescens]MCW1886167.1 type II toxin-antitoxin system RelE/ParE family toxin [Luteolibacter flavescens]
MIQVRLHEGAIRDLREILDQLSNDSERAVEQFYVELDAAAEFITRHPGAGHPCRRFRRWNFRKFPYHLIYIAPDGRGETWIMAVRHDRRHPGYGMRRRVPDPRIL